MRGRFIVKAYGIEISDGANMLSALGVEEAKTPQIAMIYSYSIGTLCKRLPVPTPFVVFGKGLPVSAGDTCANGLPNEMFWSMLPTDRTTAIAIEEGEFLELLSEIETRGISGGLTIENPRFENNQLCATIHVWAKIEVFGAKAEFDERVPICIPLQGCHTVWSIAIAELKVCFRAPSDICVELCVGKWGLSKCWDQCVHIPLLTGAAGNIAEKDCNCRH